MLRINKHIYIPAKEINFQSFRSSGPGGQHVNKVETAVQLRFDIRASSLPVEIKNILLKTTNKKITKSGVIIIRVQKYRSQQKNKEEALKRFVSLIKKLIHKPKKRKLTKPSAKAKAKRLEEKKRKGQKKELRKKVVF